MADNTQDQNQDLPPQRSNNLDSINSAINSTRNLLDTLKQARQIVKLARVGSAASGLIASFPVWGPIAAILLVIIITIIIIINPKTAEAPGTPGGPETPLPSGIIKQPEMPGLVIEKSASPLELADDSETVQFTIIATYTGTNEKNIIIKDPIPSNAEFVSATGNFEHNEDNTLITWKLDPDVNTPDVTESGKKYTFTLTVKPKENNSTIANAAYGESIEVAGVTVIPNSCIKSEEGVNRCSIDALKPYFGGDESKALKASMICKRESGSDPFVINSKCPPDYSIGLFQINLLYHCIGAYQEPKSSCILIDEPKRDQCSDEYLNPEGNIQKMLAISNNGTNWSPWSTWPGVRAKLNECGIVQ